MRAYAREPYSDREKTPDFLRARELPVLSCLPLGLQIPRKIHFPRGGGALPPRAPVRVLLCRVITASQQDLCFFSSRQWKKTRTKPVVFCGYYTTLYPAKKPLAVLFYMPVREVNIHHQGKRLTSWRCYCRLGRLLWVLILPLLLYGCGCCTGLGRR